MERLTRLHIIPVGDSQEGKLKLHVAAMDCWCNPLVDGDMATHNAFDCRESRERQGIDTGKIWTHVLENKFPNEEADMTAQAMVMKARQIGKYPTDFTRE